MKDALKDIDYLIYGMITKSYLQSQLIHQGKPPMECLAEVQNELLLKQ